MTSIVNGNEADLKPYVAWVVIEKDVDAARAVGKWGRNRARIEKAFRCSIVKSADSTYFEIRGTYGNATTAATIIRCSMAHHGRGDLAMHSEDVQSNCTVMHIPRETVKMVLGKSGSHLQSLEDQCEVVMFLAQIVDQQSKPNIGTLVIFGGKLGRRLAQLLVMKLVESIVDGTFTKPWYENSETFDTESDLDGDWGTTVLEISSGKEMAWILGSDYTMVRKLMRTSRCAIGAINNLLYISGSKQQRANAGKHIDLLIQALYNEHSKVEMDRPEKRTDCKVITIPDHMIARVVGPNRETLNKLEEDFDVLIYSLMEKSYEHHEKTFVIFGPDFGSQLGAQLRLQELMELECPHFIKFPKLEKSEESGFAVDYLRLTLEDATRVIGKQGWMQRLLSLASHAVIRVIRNVCCIGGDIHERHRAHSYIEWLLFDFFEEAKTLEACHREDVTDIKLSESRWRNITRADCRRISQETDTFVFFTKTLEGEYGIRVCGYNAGEQYRDKGRAQAAVLIQRACDGHEIREEKRGLAGTPPMKAARFESNRNDASVRSIGKEDEDYISWNDSSAWSEGKEEWNYDSYSKDNSVGFEGNEVGNHERVLSHNSAWSEGGDMGNAAWIRRRGKDDPKTQKIAAKIAQGETITRKSPPKESDENTSTLKNQLDGRWGVFVAGLPAESTNVDLRQLCEQVLSESGLASDEPFDCEVKPGRGCGRLQFSSRRPAEIAIQELHQRKVMGWQEPLRARWTVKATQHKAYHGSV